MNQIFVALKALLKNYVAHWSLAEPINNSGDYVRVKRWTKKVIVLMSVFTVIAFVWIFAMGALVFGANSLMQEMNGEGISPIVIFLFSYILMPFALILSNWGYAMIILDLPNIAKSVMKSARFGYDAGKNIETTHVQVTHEFGNNYRVSSYTDNKGCLFGFIAGMAKFMVWAVFCVYVAPFLTFKKLKASFANMKAFQGTV